MNYDRVSILGAGSWGTAVAISLAEAGHHVKLWAHRPEHVDAMLKDGCNHRYLPQIAFPKRLTPCSHFDTCLTESDYIIIAVPSHAFSSLLARISTRPKLGIAWLTKGIEPQTHQLLSECVTDKWGDSYPFAIISGPSFAREVAMHLPTTILIAGNNREYSKQIQMLLHQKNLRVYLSQDPIGVQVCGAVKNILAIACGISDGLHFGANAKAALITRGIAEMSRLGLALGARQDTFMGLAGVGDLVLTCTDNQSRNRRFGLQLGAGQSLIEAEKVVGQVVEGKYNAQQVCALSVKHHVEMPICQTINGILTGTLQARDAVTQLMARPPKEE